MGTYYRTGCICSKRAAGTNQIIKLKLLTFINEKQTERNMQNDKRIDTTQCEGVNERHILLECDSGS